MIDYRNCIKDLQISLIKYVKTSNALVLFDAERMTMSFISSKLPKQLHHQREFLASGQFEFPTSIIL